MTKIADCFVSVVAPLRDDEDIVAGFVEEVCAVLHERFTNYEVVLVDDRSRDRTLDVLQHLLTQHAGVRVVRLSRSFGQETAIAAGLDSAIGDEVVVMLPDSDPPALIPEMVALARNDGGVVYGLRRSRESQPIFLRLGSRLFFWFAQWALRLPIPTNATHFRVLSRQAVNAVSRVRDRKRYLRTLTEHVGYGSTPFQYDPIQRRPKARQKSPVAAAALAIDIVVANTTRPLRFLATLALTASVLSVMTGIYVLVFPHWPTAQRAIAVWLAALVAAGFAIMAGITEYLGQLLEEVKDRPLYHTMDELASTSPFPHEERVNVVSGTVEA